MRQRITVRAEVHFGKPCVAGMRIPVQSVLELVRDGLSFAEITQQYYPDLAPEDLYPFLVCAVDARSAL